MKPTKDESNRTDASSQMVWASFVIANSSEPTVSGVGRVDDAATDAAGEEDDACADERDEDERPSSGMTHTRGTRTTSRLLRSRAIASSCCTFKGLLSRKH